MYSSRRPSCISSPAALEEDVDDVDENPTDRRLLLLLLLLLLLIKRDGEEIDRN
jgi:hypothetical protein